MGSREAVRSEVSWGEGVVSYLRAGGGLEGGPVVLLHGLGGSAAVWARNMAAIARRHDVVAPELWGQGRFAGEPPTVDAGVRFLTGFMDALGIARAHVVGVSLGGLIGGWMAVRHPARVTSLTLVGSAGLGRQIAWSQRLMTLPGVGEVFFRPSVQRVRSLLRLLMPSTRPPDELVGELVRASRGPEVTRQMLAALRAGVGLRGLRPHTLLVPHLPSLSAPTLLCWGSRDPLFPVSHAEAAVDAMPNARLRVFTGAGHWPFYEQAEAFNATLLEHIDRAERSAERSRPSA